MPVLGIDSPFDTLRTLGKGAGVSGPYPAPSGYHWDYLLDETGQRYLDESGTPYVDLVRN